MSTFSSGVHVAFTDVGHPLVMYSEDGVWPDRTPSLDDRVRRAAVNRVQTNVACWYGEMASYWTTIEPPQRRRLVLRVHQWIADSAFVNGVLRPDVMEDLGPGGLLAVTLAELVPPDERQRWRPWIRATLRDLRLTLGSPPFLQTEAWWRRLFLGPSYVPGPAWRPSDARSV